jgi:hypothetical protein
VAIQELLADRPPFNTDARLDDVEKCLWLHGAGKFAVVNGASAHWVAILANVIAGSGENLGPRMLFVQLRDERSGALLPGVKVEPIQGQGSLIGRVGASVIYFDHLRVPYEALDSGVVVEGKRIVPHPSGKENTTFSYGNFLLRRRVASIAIYQGVNKAACLTLIKALSKKHVLGKEGRRDVPLMSLQHIQTPAVSCVVTMLSISIAWETLLSRVFPQQGVVGSIGLQDESNTVGLAHFLQQNLIKIHAVSSALGLPGRTVIAGFEDAIHTVAMRQEGADPTFAVREMAQRYTYSSDIQSSLKSRFWDYVSQIGRLNPLSSKFPLYSTARGNNKSSRAFFNVKHHVAKQCILKEQMANHIRFAEEPDFAWMDHWTIMHDHALGCGEAITEIFIMDSLISVKSKVALLSRISEELLNHVTWCFATSRQMESMTYLIHNKILSHRQARAVARTMDNLSTSLASQCPHFVESLNIPEQWWSPMARESKTYWTIPGAEGFAERSQAVEEFIARHHRDSKEEQEKMEEEPFDILHGVDKQNK